MRHEKTRSCLPKRIACILMTALLVFADLSRSSLVTYAQEEEETTALPQTTEDAAPSAGESPDGSGITASGEQMSAHVHVFSEARSNANGTHTMYCIADDCAECVTVACVPDEEGNCSVCGYAAVPPVAPAEGNAAEGLSEAVSGEQSGEQNAAQNGTASGEEIQGQTGATTGTGAGETPQGAGEETKEQSGTDSGEEGKEQSGTESGEEGKEQSGEGKTEGSKEGEESKEGEGTREGTKEDTKEEAGEKAEDSPGAKMPDNLLRSPAMSNRGTGEYDYEEASGKTFSQTVKITFPDTSLLNASSSVTVYLYGNIEEKKVLKDGAVSADRKLIDEKTINVSASSATATCTFDKVPIYLKKGTGDATSGGSGRYEVPENFYGILIKTADGYQADKGTGNNYAVCTLAKDPNEAIWTTQEITISNSIPELVSPSFQIEWQDNRNFAEKRPYSTGATLNSGSVQTIAGRIQLYYEEGENYVRVEDDSSILLVSGSNHPASVTAASFSTWNLTFRNLPKKDANETEYQWFIRLGDDFLNDNGVDSSQFYKISGYQDGYLPISESGTDKLTLTYSDDVTGRIVWRTDASSGLPTMPTGELFAAAGMKLYSKIGSADAVDITDNGNYSVTWTSGTDAAGRTVWEYRIQGLPQYDASGNAIVYYTVISSNPYTHVTGTGAPQYKFSYDNGSTSAETDKCLSGHTIYAIITADATFSAKKVWYDGNDDASVERRKEAISKGITLYLWRYPGNKGISAGAPVTKNALQYSYDLTETDAGSAGDSGNSIDISFPNFSNSDTFPKYDEMGYEYVYYVTEVSASSLYETHYHNGTGAYDGTSTDTCAKNDGSICNVRSAKIAPALTKRWNVSAVTDYVGSECTFMLQRKTGGDTWEDVEPLTLKGFTSGNKTISGVFNAQAQYDGMGQRYEYRVIETNIKSGGNEDAVFDRTGWIEDGNKWTSTYELNGYTYQAVSDYDLTVGTNGIETAKATITNQLHGTKELTITKTWEGVAWEIGTDDSKTGTITLKLKRAVDGSNATEYATVVMQKPQNETSGKGTFTVTGCSDTSVNTNNGTFAVEEAHGVQGAKWESAAVTVPAYTTDGQQYIYTIEETYIATTDTTLKYTRDYDKEISGKTIKLFVENEISTTTHKTRIDVQKIWKDDSDTSQRAPVKVTFGTYDSNGVFTAATNSDDNNALYELILSDAKDYENHIWVNAEDFMTAEEKTTFAAASTDEQTALRRAAIRNHLSIQAAMQGDNQGDYSREILHQTVEPINNESGATHTLTGGVIAATGSDTTSYRPGYKVGVVRNDSGTSFTITNTRAASRSFTFTKAWEDSDNLLKGRGNFLRVALFREDNGAEKEIAYIDIPTYDSSTQTNLTSGEALKVTFTNGGEYYPAYDDKGNAYRYSLKEYICIGTPVTGETKCDDNGNERDTSSVTKVEVSLQDTPDTTTTGYVAEVGATVTTDKLVKIAQGTSGLGYSNVDNWLINEAATYTNKAAGERSEVSFYLLWHDVALSNARPDVHLTLYYTVGTSGEPQPYTGSYTERWEYVEQGNQYVQKAVFSGLPAADASGNVYTYYVAETLNNAAADYTVACYKEPLLTTGGSAYNSSVVDKPTGGGGVLIVKDGVSTTDIKNANGNPLVSENSFAVIGISDTIKIQGRKLWQNTPAGISATHLPQAKIYLFRESDYDKSNKVPDASNDYETKAVGKISETDGSGSPQKLNNSKSLYIYGTYETTGENRKHWLNSLNTMPSGICISIASGK